MVKWLYPNRMKSDPATKEIIHQQVAQLGKFINFREKSAGCFCLYRSALDHQGFTQQSLTIQAGRQYDRLNRRNCSFYYAFGGRKTKPAGLG